MKNIFICVRRPQNVDYFFLCSKKNSLNSAISWGFGMKMIKIE